MSVFLLILATIYASGTPLVIMFRKATPTNELQDDIRWMPIWKQALLWPILLFAWLRSCRVFTGFQGTYVPHHVRMDGHIQRVIGEYESIHSTDADKVHYRIPSPKEWRERGIAAADITIYEE
jgi:hypothetical protein